MTDYRWKFHDPGTAETYRFPHNPKSMTSPTPGQVTTTTLTSVKDARPRAHTTPKITEWSFSGPYKTRQFHDDLLAWFERNRPLEITDHYGRTFLVLLTRFEAVDARPRSGVPFRGVYTMTGYVLEERA